MLGTLVSYIAARVARTAAAHTEGAKTDGLLIDEQNYLMVSLGGAAAALPSDAATQTTLAALNAKTPSLGQALAAGSVPVVLTAAQVTDLKTVAVSTPAAATVITHAVWTIAATDTPLSGAFPRGGTFLNTSATQTLYIGTTGVTTSGATKGFTLLPGASITRPTWQNLNVIHVIASAANGELSGIEL
jgi:hypothetical protein